MTLSAKAGVGTLLMGAGMISASVMWFYPGGDSIQDEELRELVQLLKKEILVDGFSNWRPLSEDNDANTYNNKYVGTYSIYFAGVGTAVAGKTPESNTEWWNWSFENRYKPNKETISSDDGFKNNITNGDTLKTACQKAYGGTKVENEDKISVTETGNGGTTKYPIDNFWKFCSPWGHKIETISESTTEKTEYDSIANSFGKTHPSSFASTSSVQKGNKLFWAEKTLKLFSPTNNPETKESEFKKLYDEYKSNSQLKKQDQLKSKCKEAYKYTTISNDDKKYPTDVVYKYCSLSGKQQSQS